MDQPILMSTLSVSFWGTRTCISSVTCLIRSLSVLSSIICSLIFLLSLEIRILIFHSAIDHLKIHTMVLWLSGQILLRLHPVWLMTSSGVLLKTMTQTGSTGMWLCRAVTENFSAWSLAVEWLESQKKMQPRRPVISCGDRGMPSTTPASGYLRFSSTAALQTPAKHISVLLAQTLCQTLDGRMVSMNACDCGLSSPNGSLVCLQTFVSLDLNNKS